MLSNPPVKKSFQWKELLSNSAYPLIILFLIFLVYGLLIFWLGYYWDDFPYIWFNHMDGPLGVVQAIALDRPFLGIFYAIPMFFLGEEPFHWQIFGLLSRWVYVMSVYGFLNMLWPHHRKMNQLICLLFTVFPGFSQQWISVIYSHAFLIFGLYFYSFRLFIKNIRTDNPSPALTIISLAISLFCMFATEYLVGLEVLRPLVIYLISKEKSVKIQEHLNIKWIIQKWAPYLVGVFGFVIYRLFFVTSVLYSPQNVNNFFIYPINSLFNLISTQIKNMFSSTMLTWWAAFKPFMHLQGSSNFKLLFFIYFIILFLGIYLLINRLWLSSELNIENRWIRQVLMGSFLSLFFLGIPFWAADLKPSTSFPYDRFLLPFMLNSTLIILLVIVFFQKKKLLFSLLFSLIFAASASSHVNSANEYRNEWKDFIGFYQQFAWRIPSIQNNTVFITDELPFQFYSDNSMTAPLNWIYATEIMDHTLPFMINYSKARLGKSLKSLEPGTSIQHNFRTYTFYGTTDQMVLFYFQPPGCVHIADPDLDIYNPLIPAEIRSFVAQSKPSLILEELKQNATFFLNTEPDDSWCYFYQKGSLAAQYHDWSRVSKLGDQAFNLNDYPNDASERMPFIEGYAMNKEIDKSFELTRLTHEISELYDPMICKLWGRINQNAANDQMISQAYQEIQAIYHCP